ncbi:hypothetical protein [Magnetospirillum sp. UT-4]|uniref:hypothetical protein n=1 Tax=Magnetospirillum sp. UT-4 TaxID=2681467 RepID=UPI0013837A70|nr:hypothetical protein [Magnetospirillum sp. UT-4]CAA7626076.1 conserved hypothetical protein [Magnetospirillum sp. UT-4]
MRKLVVSIVPLGSLKHSVNMQGLEKWPSKLFTIRHGASVNHLPDAAGNNWEYTKVQLNNIVRHDEQSDITLALINAKLEGNYYIRTLSRNIAVISLYEMADIVLSANLTIENFILRNTYELATIYEADGHSLDNAYTWPHDDIRGCLYDMNANKYDIIFSMHRPSLCGNCRSKIQSMQVRSGFLPAIDAELRLIKKTLYFRINEWIKSHPLYALAIAAASATSINLIASVIFESVKRFIPWIS